MSNLLNFALGGLTGAVSGSPLQSVVGSPLGTLTGAKGASPLAGLEGLQSLMSRDGQMPQLAEILSAVNALQQAVGSGQSADSAQPPLPLPAPASAPTPAPESAPNAPGDDRGPSNVVFCSDDGDGDGAFIH